VTQLESAPFSSAATRRRFHFRPGFANQNKLHFEELLAKSWLGFRCLIEPDTNINSSGLEGGFIPALGGLSSVILQEALQFSICSLSLSANRHLSFESPQYFFTPSPVPRAYLHSRPSSPASINI
jgi:hypothetical protein